MPPKSITKPKMSKGAVTAPTKQSNRAAKRAQAPAALQQVLMGTEEGYQELRHVLTIYKTG